MSIQTPEWVKHAVFYQIFPDRFARTQRHIDHPEMAVLFEPWDSPPTLSGYKGGDLWGIAEKLDYLKDLGISALYLTPIFQSTCNHRYHTHDYYQVDPLLGGNEAFQDLLEAAYSRHIRVVLDGVFNHASRGFFYFNDILENGPHSPWLEWFKVTSWPLSAYDGAMPANYTSWVNNRALPQFNHDNPAVREYIMRIGEYWIRQGIDGWRLDVPFEVQVPGFWQEFRDRIKAINPEAYIVGEIWTPAQQWLDGTQFDAVMNYPFTGPTMAFAAGDRVAIEHAESPEYYPYPALDAAGYRAKMENLLSLYDWEIQLAQLNLLSSHDVARALTVMGDDQKSLELAVLLQMTFPGAPCVYYGDEVGLDGGLDPDCRKVFPAEDQWNKSLLEHHQALIGIRNQYAALRIGDYRPFITVDHLYGFQRQKADESLIVLVNTGEKEMHIDLADYEESAQSTYQVLYGPIKITQAETQIAIPSRSGGILLQLASA
ncbi:glycoside hydrolase family 13 protein [Oscillatoria sp. CS-180]|uniref:glycoside hydrolase family 13 protein n=1 Tax=Oscillatoria sp. CS-180 TaxID=3021720 RepID=UPI00232FD1A9|nr:glycoside hydrolase family 13 protein [Oscillatoria sp. CS-180]MDB9527775.1 glycoside hydrolase family 13 protein [Oscillatoria sp. CS-180]